MSKSLRICVLGGTGFVGTELVTRLAAQGHAVRVPTRHISSRQSPEGAAHLQLVAANIHDLRVLGQLFRGHGCRHESRRHPQRARRATGFARVHAELAGKVVEAMRASRVTRLLHMSSLGAGAQAPSQYLRSKGDAEAHVRVAPATLDATDLPAVGDLRAAATRSPIASRDCCA